MSSLDGIGERRSLHITLFMLFNKKKRKECSVIVCVCSPWHPHQCMSVMSAEKHVNFRVLTLIPGSLFLTSGCVMDARQLGKQLEAPSEQTSGVELRTENESPSKMIREEIRTQLSAGVLIDNGIGVEPAMEHESEQRGEGNQNAMSWALSIFSTTNTATNEQLARLLQEAETNAQSIYDEESARTWANGYKFPSAYIESDEKCLRAAQLCFVTMVRRRLKLLSGGRRNLTRVANLRSDNPERELLQDLCIGMRVHLPVGFVPNGSLPPSPLRATYVAVAPAVNKMLGEIRSQNLAFLIPLQLARENVSNPHFAKAHWTKKKGKPSGRPLGDLSFVDGTPLNTPETAAAAADYYGAIRHPTIEDIATMVCKFWRSTVANNAQACFSSLRMWKMDLRGAYQLLTFRPEDAGLFAMMLTEDLVYFQVAGIFGWAGTPAAFQVITRAVAWELRHRLTSASIMYVDDIIGVGLEKDISADLAAAKVICTDLLGPTAVADDKTEAGRRIDVIGYTIDLDTQRILIARKNHLTALHGFCSVDVSASARISLRSAQRIASWSSRYGKICRVMRPFCGALNRMIGNRLHIHASLPLSAEAAIAIRCWRAMLCLVRYSETEFTRTLLSFDPSPSGIIAEFDASLQGAGLVWYMRTENTEVAVGVCAVELSFLGFGDDSSYQNLAEFVGAVLAIAGQVVMGYQGQSVSLRGDSITALTWAVTERTRGAIVTRAAMVWALLCVAADIHIHEVTHIPGEANRICDGLSRRGSAHALSVEDHAAILGISGARTIDVSADDDIMGLLELCRPASILESDEQFVAFWTTARSTVNSFISRYPSFSPPPSLT